jgi:hypothetical protein
MKFSIEGSSSHVYEVRPRKDKRGVDLISDVLPFGRLWYDTPDSLSQQPKPKLKTKNTEQ